MEYEVWYEKWRPKKFDDLVYDDKDKLKKLLQRNKTFPHLLLHSKSGGTGKGSIYNVIANETGADKKVINASQDTSIDNIRKVVNEFVSTKSWTSKSRKILFLDEVDGLSKQAFDSLKGTMEKYVNNVIFILSTNKFEKIPKPIVSRCVPIDLKSPKRDKILERLKFICETEKVDIDDKSLKRLVKINYPDMRAMVKMLQDLSENATQKIEYDMIVKEQDRFEIIWELVKDKQVIKARNKMLMENLNPENLCYYLFKRVEEDYPNKIIQVEVAELFATIDDRINKSANPEIQVHLLFTKLCNIIE